MIGRVGGIFFQKGEPGTLAERVCERGYLEFEDSRGETVGLE